MNIFPIIALDVGTKRVGLAYMEQLSGAADIRKILPREANKALNQILTLLRQKYVRTLVAGLPLGARQQRTVQCEDVEGFCRRIERRFKIDTIYIDEYLTSNEAEKIVSGKQVRIDDVAAEIILKRFLVLQGLLNG